MRNKKFIKRKMRVRGKILGTKERPRLTVFRSNKNLYAQIIDDNKMVTLIGLSSKMLSGKDFNRMDSATKLGEEIALLAKKAKIKKVVFDKSGYKYHGRIKAFTEAARKGGLEF